MAWWTTPAGTIVTVASGMVLEEGGLVSPAMGRTVATCALRKPSGRAAVFDVGLEMGMNKSRSGCIRRRRPGAPIWRWRATLPPNALQARTVVGYRPGGSGQIAENGQYGAWSPTGADTVATATDIGRLMIAQLAGDPRLGAGVARLIQQQHFTMDPRLPGLGYNLQEQPRDGQPLLFKDG
jgi:hypothetical protein